MNAKRARRALSTDTLLSHDEIVDLTERTRFKAQRRQLTKMGVRHIVRGDGSPVVARALVTAMLARYNETSATPDDGVLNLAAIRNRGGKRNAA